MSRPRKSHLPSVAQGELYRTLCGRSAQFTGLSIATRIDFVTCETCLRSARVAARARLQAARAELLELDRRVAAVRFIHSFTP